MSTSIAERATVCADDGTPLAAWVFGDLSAAVTVVFVHGHCLRTESWWFLRDELRRQRGPDIRMVFYDHRGHGESGAADPSTYTIDQLGHDLDAVLRALTPTGPVVLIGHSMGAMAVLAYARLFPDAIGTRIVGVGLIAAAAASITAVGLGRFLNRRTVTSFRIAVQRAPRAVQASKRLGRRIFEPIVREASFGSGRVNPRMAAVATAMLNDTPLPTMAHFLDSLLRFDETPTLRLLADVPALVLGGSADILIPFAHSVVLAAQLDRAELVRLDGAGHSVILERAEEVAIAIAALVDRAVVPVQPAEFGPIAARPVLPAAG
ncbi:alpha/beta fold hydrolase [Nocardia veterana]|uniref:Alpha/beta hydrolase n=1 Tax=Nocardia veterana TaxID=132249 RepID=A0A7X6RH84_9NOCA|nr:alpha/beta hydrolase [Nocardia veterana]NKY85836.1 alpha/beta hydrolase [Nocardia veterana]